MKTLVLPPHTLHYLTQHNHALHLVPMEPQPPYDFGEVKTRDGKVYWYWDDQISGNVRRIELTPPYTPGEVLAVAEPFTPSHIVCVATGACLVMTAENGTEFRKMIPDGVAIDELLVMNPGVPRPASEMPSWAARTHVVVRDQDPLRLAELTEEQANDFGFYGWYMPTHPDIGSTDGRTPEEECREWWEQEHPSHPWQTTYCWAVRLERGEAK